MARVTVAVSGLTAFLQVFRASNIKMSKRLQSGVGHGSREAAGLPASPKKCERGDSAKVLCFYSESAS